jgi:hypothetical protein
MTRWKHGQVSTWGKSAQSREDGVPLLRHLATNQPIGKPIQHAAGSKEGPPAYADAAVQNSIHT